MNIKGPLTNLYEADYAFQVVDKTNATILKCFKSKDNLRNEVPYFVMQDVNDIIKNSGKRVIVYGLDGFWLSKNW